MMPSAHELRAQFMAHTVEMKRQEEQEYEEKKKLVDDPDPEVAWHAKDYCTQKEINAKRNDRLWKEYGDLWSQHARENRLAMLNSMRAPWPANLTHSEAHVICGAGPGLDLVLDHLRTIRFERLATIWCVDAAYLPLRRAGIMPDAVVSLDYEPNVIPKFLRAFNTESANHPPCIFFPQSPPQAVKEWRGRVLFAAGVDTLERIGAAVAECHFLPTIPSHGTVSGVATMLARGFGYESPTRVIAFAGNDLSYPVMDGRAYQYCRNTIHANQPDGSCIADIKAVAEADQGGKLFPIKRKTAAGETVREVWITAKMSNYAEVFRKWFQAEKGFAQREKRPAVLYLNTTPGLFDLYSQLNKDEELKYVRCEQLASVPMSYFVDYRRQQIKKHG